ncbi:MAG: hypothetical protein IJO06_08825 [Thermoguttaceae bacterium]|nr:hypothetical protein [Thermoguttaceae bacterium]
MKIFKDANGGEWSFELTAFEFKRTRDKFGDLLDPDYCYNKTRDAVFLVDLLFELVGEQAAKRGIDAAAFARLFKGDAVDEARRAFLEEYVAFFPSRARERLSETIAKIDRGRELTAIVGAANLAKETEKLAKKAGILAKGTAEKLERSVSGDLSSNLPESPDSIPTDERSEN